jgi:hypothetical protein
VKYICMEDIENLAAQGKKELVVDGNTVVMEMARDMARQMGITIVDGTRPAPAKTNPPAGSAAPAKVTPPATPAGAARAASPVAAAGGEAAPKPAAAKPRGCQHGALPAGAGRPEQPKSQPGSDGVVDQLVELVRQSTGKRSGN